MVRSNSSIVPGTEASHFDHDTSGGITRRKRSNSFFPIAPIQKLSYHYLGASAVWLSRRKSLRPNWVHLSKLRICIYKVYKRKSIHSGLSVGPSIWVPDGCSFSSISDRVAKSHSRSEASRLPIGHLYYIYKFSLERKSWSVYRRIQFCCCIFPARWLSYLAHFWNCTSHYFS